MKYVKILGLLAVAAAALMAFAGSASAATNLTSPANTNYEGTIHAVAGETTLHGVVTITCHESTVDGNAAAVSTHVGGNISSLTFGNCTNGNHVTVNQAGSLTLVKTTLYSTGAKVTVQVTSLGLTCVFTTNETEIGTATGGTTAKLDIDSVKIPRTEGSIFCGSSGEWTGSYSVDSPDTLLIDHS